MYFDTGLEIGDYIYLIEHTSRCLISIHTPSGETNIEAYLPLEYTESKICMLELNYKLLIYSPAIAYFLIYDCLNHHLTNIKLQEIEADEAGFYYSNILTFQDSLIVLPFKGKEIKKYEMNGKLKYKDNRWYSTIAKKCSDAVKLYGNIRMDSACIVENQLFFSLVYGNQNYLCKYELNQEKPLCNIIYYSEDIPIRGIYSYSNIILFRRLSSEKTEIALVSFDSNKQKSIIIDTRSMFEDDIFGDIQNLRISSINGIFEIDENSLSLYWKFYNFEYTDVYIANGILFNILRNEIILLNMDYIRKYSIEKITNEIRNCKSYQEGYKKLFDGKCIREGRNKLYGLINYLTEFLPVENKKIEKNNSVSKLIWSTIQ